jgi:hypothetical protein
MFPAPDTRLALPFETGDHGRPRDWVPSGPRPRPFICAGTYPVADNFSSVSAPEQLPTSGNRLVYPGCYPASEASAAIICATISRGLDSIEATMGGGQFRIARKGARQTWQAPGLGLEGRAGR